MADNNSINNNNTDCNDLIGVEIRRLYFINWHNEHPDQFLYPPQTGRHHLPVATLVVQVSLVSSAGVTLQDNTPSHEFQSIKGRW